MYRPVVIERALHEKPSAVRLPTYKGSIGREFWTPDTIKKNGCNWKIRKKIIWSKCKLGHSIKEVTVQSPNGGRPHSFGSKSNREWRIKSAIE